MARPRTGTAVTPAGAPAAHADKAQRGIQSVEVGARLLAALAAARVPMPLAAL
ncbi:MAG: IclR family transcriptional regulator, partial [Cupriavidus sp.]|nr:IclR family transcriptional regulator [Cupriavidus sp.]NUT14177.1 IclR family transcriptional regulator [Cupriavidus sp.]